MELRYGLQKNAEPYTEFIKITLDVYAQKRFRLELIKLVLKAKVKKNYVILLTWVAIDSDLIFFVFDKTKSEELLK